MATGATGAERMVGLGIMGAERGEAICTECGEKSQVQCGGKRGGAVGTVGGK